MEMGGVGMGMEKSFPHTSTAIVLARANQLSLASERRCSAALGQVSRSLH